MPDYQNGKIYKIIDNTNNNIYIGSTCQTLSQRLSKHKTNYKLWEDGRNRKCTSFDILCNDDYEIILIESVHCNNKDELHARERHYQQTLNCINKTIVGRTLKEYYMDNIEKIRKYTKDNKEKMKEYHKTRNATQEVIEKRKKYWETNKEKIQTYRNTEYKCECGTICQFVRRIRHFKSKKHLEYIENK